MTNRAKIGITQKIITITDRNERVDALDQRWALFFEKCGMDIVQIPNSIKNIEHYLNDMKLSGFVLSGGGDLSRIETSAENSFDYDRERIEDAIIDYSQKNKIPLIGVCRGMQCLCLRYGAKIQKISGHAGSNHVVKVINSFFGVNNGMEITVNSFHNFGISLNGLPIQLVPLAIHENFLEAVQHSIHPQIGVMWHPERNSPFSKKDIELFTSFFLRGI